MQLIRGICLYLRPSEGLVLKTSTNISLNFLLRFWIVSILSCWSPPPGSISGPGEMLNLIRHVDPVNRRRMILRMHHAVKRDCGTFRMRERTGFAGLKRVTAVEVPLQRIFTAKVLKSLLQQQGYNTQTIKALIGFASQRQEIGDRGVRLALG